MPRVYVGRPEVSRVVQSPSPRSPVRPFAFVCRLAFRIHKKIILLQISSAIANIIVTAQFSKKNLSSCFGVCEYFGSITFAHAFRWSCVVAADAAAVAAAARSRTVQRLRNFFPLDSNASPGITIFGVNLMYHVKPAEIFPSAIKEPITQPNSSKLVVSSV